jgi:tRNA-Thr(GGU) m(6)t(6)A37 methyltransferase TsaA
MSLDAIPAIHVQPIGFVRNSRTGVQDDDWESVESEIELSGDFDPESLNGIEEFSHAEILFHFDRRSETEIVRGLRRPRDNPNWPLVGIFAQRVSARPNRLGATIVTIAGRDGRVLRVKGLDAIDGTPVLDIKPVLGEFLPRGEVRQPQWSRELMANYWRHSGHESHEQE